MVNVIVEIFAAAVAAFALGMLWHGPLFGKAWMKMTGYTAKSMKKMKCSPAKSMSLCFVSLLVVGYVLNLFLLLLGASTLKHGLVAAGLLWLGFSAPVIFGGYLWENKSFKLTAFNAAYRLVELVVMAAVLTSL